MLQHYPQVVSGHLELPIHNKDTLREERLQHYLTGVHTGSTPDAMCPLAGDALGDDDSDEDAHENDDSNDHPDLTRLREWFLSANAMQRLRDRFRLFVYPEKPTIVDISGDITTTKDSVTLDNSQQATCQYIDNSSPCKMEYKTATVDMI
jgi:hypothetical protein